MDFFHWILVVAWICFLLTWTISSLNVKRDIVPKYGVIGIWIMRLVFVFVLLEVIWFRPYEWDSVFASSAGAHLALVLEIIASLFVVFGIGLAIWARYHLGRNWSSHPALKENHELVTSGPYAIVRHPIYTGMLFALLGTAIFTGLFWFIFFVVMVSIFVWRVFREERLMMKVFPNEYPAYRARTKALIPFIW